MAEAAFGRYPQLKPKRSKQDPEAAKNVPADVLRGRVAGTLGIFGDVVNQPIPMVRPLQMISQALTKKDKYPDTEYMLENLPLKNDAPVSQAAGRAGSFVPINPAPLANAAVDAVKRAGSDFAQASYQGSPHMAGGPDMSRRGFLKLLGAVAAQSALPKAAVAAAPLAQAATPAAEAAATVARTVSPLNAAALAKVKNTLPHIAERVDRRGFDHFDRSEYIEIIKPKDMPTSEFIRSLKTNHPEQYDQMLKDIDRMQNEIRWAGHGHYKTKEAYLDSMSGDTEGLAREARLWDLRKGNVREPKNYLPEDIPFKVFEAEMAEEILDKLPVSKGGALAQLPEHVQDRIFAPLVGKSIKEVKDILGKLQQTLPAEIASSKTPKEATSKILEHFSQDPDALIIQAGNISGEKSPKELMSAWKKFDEDSLYTPRELAINKMQKELVEIQKRQETEPDFLEQNKAEYKLNPESIYLPNIIKEREELIVTDSARKLQLEDELQKAFDTPSPYTQEVLSLEERRANLAKMLEPSVEKGQWYHGTGDDFKAFNPELSKEKPNQAVASFVSEDIPFAESFANDAPDHMMKKAEKYLTPDQMQQSVEKAKKYFTETYGKDMPEHAEAMIKSLDSGKPVGEAQDELFKSYRDMLPSGPNIMPVNVQVKKPFDPAVSEHVEELRAINPNLPFDKITQTAVLETPDVQKAIQDAQFDAFYTNESGVRNLGIYDPKKIKSSIGNRGTYDVTNEDINYKDGGSVKSVRKAMRQKLHGYLT